MSVKNSAGTLAQAAKDLSVEWQQAEAHWRDVKAREFAKNYLDVIPEHVARTLSVMEDLEAILRKVRSDCE